MNRYSTKCVLSTCYVMMCLLGKSSTRHKLGLLDTSCPMLLKLTLAVAWQEWERRFPLPETEAWIILPLQKYQHIKQDQTSVGRRSLERVAIAHFEEIWRGEKSCWTCSRKAGIYDLKCREDQSEAMHYNPPFLLFLYWWNQGERHLGKYHGNM